MDIELKLLITFGIIIALVGKIIQATESHEWPVFIAWGFLILFIVSLLGFVSTGLYWVWTL